MHSSVQSQKETSRKTFKRKSSAFGIATPDDNTGNQKQVSLINFRLKSHAIEILRILVNSKHKIIPQFLIS